MLVLWTFRLVSLNRQLKTKFTEHLASAQTRQRGLQAQEHQLISDDNSPWTGPK